MKLPKNYFNNLSTSKYREYLKLLPNIHQEHTKAILMLIFTFVALSFFGIFAINPTLTTIVELKRQVTDSEFVLAQLTSKINNLSQLQQQYTAINSDLPIVYDAIPQNASAALLVGQIETLAKKNAVTIITMQVPKVQLSGKEQSDVQGSSFTFALEAEGEYRQLSPFIASLANFNRLVTIESLNLQKSANQDTLVLQVQGRSYFKK